MQAKEPDPVRREHLFPFAVEVFPAGVNCAVDFHSHLRLGAVEIEDISTHRMLSTELPAVQPAAT
jgi:hypothetical protein